MSVERTKIIFVGFALFVVASLALVSSQTVRQPVPPNVYPEQDIANPFPLGDTRPSPEATYDFDEMQPSNTPRPSVFIPQPLPSVIAGTNYDVPQISKNTGSQMYTEQRTDKPTIFYPSVYFGGWGTSLILTGDRFAATGNTVNFGKYPVSGLASIGDGRGIVFRIPQSVPAGRYTVTVSSADGLASPGVPFVVTTPGSSPPTVRSVSQMSVKAGDTLRIEGSGFDAEGNDVLLGYAILRDVTSSDGKTIEITVPAFKEFSEVQAAAHDKGIEYPFGVVIVTDGGIGTYQSTLTLRL